MRLPLTHIGVENLVSKLKNKKPTCEWIRGIPPPLTNGITTTAGL